MRGLLVVVGALALSVTPAWACKPIAIKPGETIEQGVQRREKAEQARYWDNAKVVILMRVTSAKVSRNSLLSKLDTVAVLRGDDAPRRLSHAPSMLGCHVEPKLEVGELVMVYLAPIDRRLGPFKRREWMLVRTVPIRETLDPRIAPALRETARLIRAG